MAIAFYPADSSLVIYAKPLPLVVDGWASDVVEFAAVDSLGVHQGDVDDAKDYYVFLQAGESPASTDVIDGAIGKDQAAAVLNAAAANPIAADVRKIMGETADDVARESSVGQVLEAVEAEKDYPGVTDVRVGVEYANGLYVGVLDVGSGLPVPEYPKGSPGL